jgi:SAM-dependent methyltransferase
LSEQEVQNRISARTILGILREYVRPASVLDVGCGIGTWLGAVQALGVADVRGIEGKWLDLALLEIDSGLVTLLDLEQGFSLGRKFDLVMCLEVAEHLYPAAAEHLIASLTRHGDLVLFSAAVPYQGGYHHVNEQFPDYWAGLFARHGFRCLDIIRPRVWADTAILWWYRQNSLVFAHERMLQNNAKLLEQSKIERPLAIMHPDGFLPKFQQAARATDEYQQLFQYLAQGGTFSVTPLPNGRFTIHKV